MTSTPDPADAAVAQLDGVVAEVVLIREQIARLQAREARTLARACRVAAEWADAGTTVSDAELAHRTVAAEVASALRVSDRTVQRQLAEAEQLVTDFPATLESLEKGRISLTHARVIVDAGSRIDEPELRAEYQNSVLDLFRLSTR